MWLINSSIGRKVVMSVTGVCLILFLTFHCAMNVVALFSEAGYNMICELLGSNYAFWLTMQNRKARGPERYHETARRSEVSWASQNMLVLGIIILLGLLLHLYNFWYNMMFAELVGMEGLAHGPADGFGWIKETFSNPVFVVLYVIWLVAIWFHLSHGFWSAMQTLGVNGKIWFKRWKVIGLIYVTVLMALFLIVVLAFAFGIAPSLCCGACA